MRALTYTRHEPELLCSSCDTPRDQPAAYCESCGEITPSYLYRPDGFVGEVWGPVRAAVFDGEPLSKADADEFRRLSRIAA